MLAHADDRGLQLGWSVFDTCNVERGHIYALDFHIDRFFGSMALAPFAPDNFGGKELISSRLDYVLEHKAKFVVDWYEEHQKHQSIRTNQYTT